MFNLATSFVKNDLLFPQILTQSTFFVYVAHTIMITGISGTLLKKVLGEGNALLLSISYFLAPILTIAICVMCYWGLKRYLPRICGVLTGER